MAVVAGGARPAAERADLRRAMVRLRMAELRDGVWLRPDNLDRTDPTWRSDVVDRQCQWFLADPQLTLDRGDADLAAGLWDLSGMGGARRRAASGDARVGGPTRGR